MKCAKDVNISEKVAGAKNYFKRKIKLLGTRKRYVKSTGASKRFGAKQDGTHSHILKELL